MSNDDGYNYGNQRFVYLHALDFSSVYKKFAFILRLFTWNKNKKRESNNLFTFQIEIEKENEFCGSHTNLLLIYEVVILLGSLGMRNETFIP